MVLSCKWQGQALVGWPWVDVALVPGTWHGQGRRIVTAGFNVLTRQAWIAG